MYVDAMEARVRFYKDVTSECTVTIVDYQSWTQYVVIDHREDVEELAFPRLSES